MIDYEARARVYDEALKTYGMENQLIVAVEELSECQKEICKTLRDQPNAVDHLAEEVANAIIMLEQVRRIFNIDDDVDWFMDRKVERLRLRILSQMATLARDEKTESGLLEED